MSTLCSVYFYTLRPKEGLINPDLVLAFSHLLDRLCSSYILAVERKAHLNSEHIHFVAVLRKPRVKSSLQRTFKNLWKKYYTTVMCRLHIGYSNDVVDYVLKDGLIAHSKNEGCVRELLVQEQAQSQLALRDVIDTSNRQNKYAVTNYEFWSNKLFNHLESVDEWLAELSAREQFYYCKQVLLVWLLHKQANCGSSAFTLNQHCCKIFIRLMPYSKLVEFSQWFLVDPESVAEHLLDVARDRAARAIVGDVELQL